MIFLRRLTFFIMIIFLMGIIPAAAKYKKLEREYVKEYCRGDIEVVLPDRTRCDCVTEEYAIEFERAFKWKEGIRQAKHYAKVLGKKPAIFFIIEDKKDYKYVNRALKNINENNLDIMVWIVRE